MPRKRGFEETMLAETVESQKGKGYGEMNERRSRPCRFGGTRGVQAVAF